MLKKSRSNLFIVTLLLTLNACADTKKSTASDATDNSSSSTETVKKYTGININWSFLPELNQNILDATKALKPKMIRYPGGTVSQTWSWEDGTTSKAKKRTPHTLDDLLSLKQATDSEVIFVLNILSKPLDNQLELLRTARDMGIAINYIEMGNELYLGKGNNLDDSGKHQENVKAFPTGKEYAKLVNEWAPAIRAEFPKAKIGISILARINKDQRLKTWNESIIDTIKSASFDAYIYHIYVNPDNSLTLNDNNISQIIKERTDIFESVQIDDDSKQVWITEYGVHADTLEKTVTLSSALADYIEANADIALPQVLYTKSDRTFFSMLTPPDADSLTALGKLFSKRWK